MIGRPLTPDPLAPPPGSLTLHHWQQLAQPHLATILDPHPGVVTKGFRPLPQDAVYRLTDLEEDEDEPEVRRGNGPLEKRGEEEEEEEGITFQVEMRLNNRISINDRNNWFYVSWCQLCSLAVKKKCCQS